MNALVLSSFTLGAALAASAQITCPGCIAHLTDDCPACLGSGQLRPCHRCQATGTVQVAGQTRICLVCDGRRYTAGSRPTRSDVDVNFPGAARGCGSEHAHALDALAWGRV